MDRAKEKNQLDNIRSKKDMTDNCPYHQTKKGENKDEIMSVVYSDTKY